MAKITKFYLNKASYIVGDDKSTSILMIDYKNNKFSFARAALANMDLHKRVDEIARDLLKRKHNVNFADKMMSR